MRLGGVPGTRLERLTRVAVGQLARPRDQSRLQDPPPEQHDLPLLPRELALQRGQCRVGVVLRQPRGVMVEPGAAGKRDAHGEHCAAVCGAVNRAALFHARGDGYTAPHGPDQQPDRASLPSAKEDRRLVTGAGRYVDDLSCRRLAPHGPW